MSEPRMIQLKNRDEWLAERGKRIGGSEAAALVGLNPWLNNVKLWEIKTGRLTSPNISNEATVYGARAEAAIRQLYELDHPEMQVQYAPDNMWLYDAYPFAHASLDGWMTDRDGRLGVLEIKTSTAESRLQWHKWDGRIPDNYYCQVLWYMMVTGAEFAELRAYIRGRTREIRDYHIERSDVSDDIAMLAETGAAFWEYVQTDTQPPLVLPNI